MLAFIFVLSAAAASIFDGTPAKNTQDATFCDYVEVFVATIIRYRAGGLPFLRIDEFDYFEVKKATFLRRVAQDIYAIPNSGQADYSGRAVHYVADCKNVFPE